MESRAFACTVVVLCLLWYVVGSSCSVLNKIFLQQYDYPITIAMISLLSISVYSVPLNRRLVPVKQRRSISLAYRFKYMLPISVGKALAVSASQLSLAKVPVSYVHTVKATMPLFAVCTARIVLGERQPYRVYLSLLPICVGVVIATVTEVSFDMAGLLAALLSTFTYNIMNTLAKKIYHDTAMHSLALLRDTAQVACLLLLPFWALTDAPHIYAAIQQQQQTSSSTEPRIGWWFVQLLLASGLLSFLQNVFAFALIRQLSALSYAVANTTKRIIVITSSLLTLHNPVTHMNVFGMLLAIVGVFGYNRAKSSTKQVAEDDKLLPTVMTRSTLSDASFLTTYPELAPSANGQLYRRVPSDVDNANGSTEPINWSIGQTNGMHRKPKLTFADESSIMDV